MTIAPIATAVIIAALYLAWEYKQAPLLDENERPVVPKPRDPVDDTAALQKAINAAISAQLAASQASVLADETAEYLRLMAEER